MTTSKAQAARTAIGAGDTFVATAVLLETEWIWRSAYGFDPIRIADSFQG